ncbi:hypothetical protein M422DRAFT_43532 [Sphaerobolus stellatus SS14]|nr:hypothetical protein M422DRAFT_43532 [Sphaerobolus stellatus SS14]
MDLFMGDSHTILLQLLQNGNWPCLRRLTIILEHGPDPPMINQVLKAFLNRHPGLERIFLYGDDFTLYNEFDLNILQNIQTLAFNIGLGSEIRDLQNGSLSPIRFKGKAPPKLRHLLIGRIDWTIFRFISSLTGLRTLVTVIDYDQLSELLESLPPALEHLTLYISAQGMQRLDPTQLKSRILKLSNFPKLKVLGGLLKNIDRNDHAGLFDLLLQVVPSITHIQVAEDPRTENEWVKLFLNDAGSAVLHSPEPALDKLLFGLSLDALQIYSPTLAITLR